MIGHKIGAHGHLRLDQVNPEERAQMSALGFVWQGRSWGLGNEAGSAKYRVWSPGSWNVDHTQWQIDLDVTTQSLEDGANAMFDDPITAARWLLIEVSNHG